VRVNSTMEKSFRNVRSTSDVSTLPTYGVSWKGSRDSKFPLTRYVIQNMFSLCCTTKTVDFDGARLRLWTAATDRHTKYWNNSTGYRCRYDLGTHYTETVKYSKLKTVPTRHPPPSTQQFMESSGALPCSQFPASDPCREPCNRFPKN
jgi:hypothetical protein